MNIKKEYQKNAETQEQHHKIFKKKRRSRQQQIDATREENAFLFDRRSEAFKKRKLINDLISGKISSGRKDLPLYSQTSVPPDHFKEPSKDYYIYINLETKRLDRLSTKKIGASENILDESEPQFLIKTQKLEDDVGLSKQENVLRRKIPLHLFRTDRGGSAEPGNYALLTNFHKERRQRFNRWRSMKKDIEAKRMDEESQPRYDTVSAKPSLKLEAYKPYIHKTREVDLVAQTVGWQKMLDNPDPRFVALMGADWQEITRKTAFVAMRQLIETQE